MKLKHKDFKFDVKSVGELDEKFWYVEGYGSVYGNKDRSGDIVLKGSMSKSIAERELVLLWQHNSDQPIGTIIDTKEKEHGLYIKARMPKSNKFVADIVFPNLESGVVKSFSIGYNTIDSEWNKEQDAFILKEIDLWEISVVTFPANEMAVVHGVKSVPEFADFPIAPENYSWDSMEAIKRVREFTGSTDKPSENYKDCFFYFDPEKVEDFGGYKLPFVDVIEEKLYAVPKAIYSVAGVLNGARGGVDIPEADKEKIKEQVAKYYNKIEDENSNIKSVRDERGIERVLKSRGFSNKEAKILIGKIKTMATTKTIQEQILENLKSLGVK